MKFVKYIYKIILIIFLLNIYFNGIFLRIILKNYLLPNKCPKISVVMPIYNGGKYLNVSLKSIQNQKMKDIEIIIINDNSNDDSLKIIREYMKSDPRIKYLENKKNRKILYCKSIGVLYSNGKYIIELDQDDMFIDDDAFNIIYEQSEKNNLDILQFNYNFGKNYPKLIKNLNKV